MDDRLRELYCKSESRPLGEENHRLDLDASCSLATLDRMFQKKAKVTHLCLLRGCVIEGDWRVFFTEIAGRRANLNTVTIANNTDTRYVEPLLNAIVDSRNPPNPLTLVLLFYKPICTDTALVDTLARAPLKYNLLLTTNTEECAGAVLWKLRTRVKTLFVSTYEKHVPLPMTLQLTNTASVAFLAAQKTMAVCPALPECVRSLWIDGSPTYIGHCMDRHRHLETLELRHAAQLPCNCIMQSITTLHLAACSIRRLLLPAQLQELKIDSPRYRLELIGQPVALRRLQIDGTVCLTCASIDWTKVTHLSLGSLHSLDYPDQIEWEDLQTLESMCIKNITPALFPSVCVYLEKVGAHGSLKQLELSHDDEWCTVGTYQLPTRLLANVTDLRLSCSFDLPTDWRPVPGAHIKLMWKADRSLLAHLAIRTGANVSCTSMEGDLLVSRARACKSRLLDLLTLARANDGVTVGTQAIESIIAMIQRSIY